MCLAYERKDVRFQWNNLLAITFEKAATTSNNKLKEEREKL
jgi:hypothetical protein